MMRSRSMASQFSLRRPRTWLVLVAALVVLVLLGSVATSITQRSTSGATEASVALQAQRDSVAPGVPASAAGAQAGAPVAKLAAVPANGAAASAQSNVQASPASQIAIPGQMLIRTATVSLEATDVNAVVARINQIATSATDGADIGYVTTQQTRVYGDTLTATMTIEVPASTYNAVMQQIRSLGTKVLSEDSSSQDVSAQYVDIDAQLQALKATQTQLLNLMSRATNVSETLAIQNQLTQIQSQINQLQGRENYLQKHSSFSDITVQINPSATVSPIKPLAWNPLNTLNTAWTAFGILGERLVDGLIYLIVFGLPLAIIVAVVWWGIVRVRGSRPVTPPTPVTPGT